MKRSHIVLDTNVLISALLLGGVPRDILQLVITGKVACSLSVPILDELRDVLQRPRFGFSLPQAMTIVAELSDLCTIVSPTETVQVIDADPADNRILECAVKAKATFIISGDAHLLALGTYRGIRILRPAEFLAIVNAEVADRKNRRKRQGDR